MDSTSIVTSFFVIFSGAAILATVALYTRQPLILAYIAIGGIAGRHGYNWITDGKLLAEIAEIGIIFLLFLLGLDMQPKALARMLRKASVVAIVSTLVFASLGFVVSKTFGFDDKEALVIGGALVFSSTIIGLKLLPTTVLHHRHVGELVVGLLLLQDLIAIIVLLLIAGYRTQASPEWAQLLLTLGLLPVLVGAAFLAVRYVLLPLLMRFDRFHEYIFLIAIGWCLGIAEIAETIGLSLEIGAFVAGVSLASAPIAQYMADHLRPLRDFFLVLFFFSLGAGFDWSLLPDVWLVSLVLAVLVLVVKPVVFRVLLALIQEPPRTGWEIGFRLGQTSEFSLLIAFLAASTALIGNEASLVIQATAIMTFIANTYVVILNYPSPIAVKDRLRRD
ncbi:cation:proton antiporter [Marinobacteraceae bacterium S3BR75-40.1]